MARKAKIKCRPCTVAAGLSLAFNICRSLPGTNCIDLKNQVLSGKKTPRKVITELLRVARKNKKPHFVKGLRLVRDVFDGKKKI